MGSTVPNMTRLFHGLTDKEAEMALRGLHATEKSYRKGEILLHAGTVTDRLGLVLAGSVTIESNDIWGNRTILGLIETGNIFAETYALLPGEPMLVDVCANEDTRILFLRADALINLSPQEELWQSKLIRNLLHISSQKNLHLSGRNFHTAPKTVRGRIMAYLNSIALRRHGNEFDIPFDRQQLADYLNLDRTALSKELGKMQKEGILKFRKNHFIVCTNGQSD